MRKKATRYMAILSLTSFLLTTAVATQPKALPKANKMPTPKEMIVAYYGRPHSSSLGVLGQHTIKELIPLIKAKTEAYKEASGNQNILPAFDIIYGLAAADPGRRKDYILPLSEKSIMEYINAANEHGLAVFLDVQLGKMTPVEAIKPILKYLKYQNVHIAIDPEFEVHGLDVRPGKIVGHITDNDVNQAQNLISNHLKENNITEEKMLVVHMFRSSMVKNKSLINGYENVDLIMNLDGHGSPTLKTKIYNGLYTDVASDKVAGGFKLFFKEDKPRLMTPKEVLGLESIGGTKIKHMPRYINYQ